MSSPHPTYDDDHQGRRPSSSRQRTRFLAGIEPFNGLSKLELERVARSIVERVAAAGEAVLVESGVPGTELYVVLRRHARARCTKKPSSP